MAIKIASKNSAWKGVASWLEQADLPVYLKLASLVFIGFFLIYMLVPDWRMHLIAEDQFVENLTSVVCLLASIVGLSKMFRLRHHRGWRLCCFITTLSLIAFLDEVSFGIRLFGWKPITTDSNYKIDGLHDFIDIAKIKAVSTFHTIWTQINGAVGEWISTGFKVALSIVVVVGLLWAFKQYRRVLGKFTVIHESPAYGIVAASVVLAAMAQIPEMIHYEVLFTVFLEEVFELNAAIGLLLAGLALQRSS